MSFYLGAYWGPRRENAEACAKRLIRCLARVESVSELLGSWYHERADARAPSPRRENWEPAPRDELGLSALIERGATQDDWGNPMPSLGFTTGFWNLRNNGGSAGLSTICGGWTQRTPNNFLLDLPEPQYASQLYDPRTAEALIRVVIETWEPDWATWTSDALAQRQDPDLSGTRLLGWVTYFSKAPKPSTKLPPGVRLHELDSGLLITIGDDPAQVPEELVLATRDALGEEFLERE